MAHKTPVIHVKCGAQIGWYLRDLPRENDRLLSQDYERMDGTHPVNGEALREKCHFCNSIIIEPKQMKRVFSSNTIIQEEDCS